MTDAPTAWTSPMAGLVDALRRQYIRTAPARIAALEQAVTSARQLNTVLKRDAQTRRDFRASVTAGLITTDLEA